jgi:hypothetical protein
LIKELQKFPCGCTCKQIGGDLVYWWRQTVLSLQGNGETF